MSQQHDLYLLVDSENRKVWKCKICQGKLKVDKGIIGWPKQSELPPCPGPTKSKRDVVGALRLLVAASDDELNEIELTLLQEAQQRLARIAAEKNPVEAWRIKLKEPLTHTQQRKVAWKICGATFKTIDRCFNQVNQLQGGLHPNNELVIKILKSLDIEYSVVREEEGDT